MELPAIAREIPNTSRLTIVQGAICARWGVSAADARRSVCKERVDGPTLPVNDNTRPFVSLRPRAAYRSNMRHCPIAKTVTNYP
jgi:hypothetical protein